MGKTDIFFNVTGTLLGLALASILVWRRLYKDFPFFFAYIISSILIAIVRLSVSGNYLTFFRVVWATEAIYTVLALLALHEVFRWVFLAFFKKWWFWLFFPGVVAADRSHRSGPYAGYQATDLTLLAAGGLLSLGGYLDTEPLAIQTNRIPSANPKSPTRVVMNALFAASAAVSRSNQ